MAEEDLDLDVDAEEAKSGGGGKKWIIIGAIVAALLIGGGAAAFFLLSGGDQPPAETAADAANGEAAPAPTPAAARGPMMYFAMEPAFVVNFPPDNDVRFMQINMQAASRDRARLEMVKEHMPAIRNALVMLLSSQSPEELNTREGKEKLRQQSLEEVRKVLAEMTGKGDLENLYFTSFVMQ